jgi:hypothetical protein
MSLYSAVEKRTNFNRFFKAKLDMELEARFKGLCFTEKYFKKNEPIPKSPHRYKIEGCGNDPWRALFFGPMFMGATASAFIFILVVLWPFSGGEDDFPFLFVLATLIWNLVWMNLLHVFNYYAPNRYAYFDRQSQKVAYIKTIKNAEEVDDHGNPCFEWADIVVFFNHCTSSDAGASSYFPFIQHIDLKRYPETKLSVVVTDCSRSQVYCYLFWERLVRFMDLSKPLPDIPEFEAYRHLDKITATFDKKNNRPKRYWQDMSWQQQLEIDKELRYQAFDFDFNGEPQQEITRPWEKWPIKPGLKETLTTKYKMKRLFIQLTCGVP